jgi:hypothetical protein
MCRRATTRERDPRQGNFSADPATRPLTLQWKPRSVGVVSEEPMATGKFVPALKLCATLLAISMATIPVCSARCAAQACAVLLPSDGAGGCHHSSSDSDSRGMKSKTMNVSCAAGEAVFTLLRAERDSPAKKSSIRPSVSPAPAAPSFDVEDSATPAPSGRIAPPQQISPVSLSQAPLRL